MHALAAVGADCGQSAICGMLGELAGRGESVCVVFDGPAPNPSLAVQMEDIRVESLYGGRREADDVIIERIAADTAPRRLTVVSSDRQIRTAARKRRCNVLTSEQFAPILLSVAEETPPAPTEPPEKRKGLTPEQTRKWLREFGFDE